MKKEKRERGKRFEKYGAGQFVRYVLEKTFLKENRREIKQKYPLLNRFRNEFRCLNYSIKPTSILVQHSLIILHGGGGGYRPYLCFGLHIGQLIFLDFELKFICHD